MDNLGILVQAILSLKDTKASKDQIASELPKLESQLQSDKNTRVKIVAGLDIAKSKNLIQSQLNTLANQAKAPAIKIGIDTSGLNSVQGATQNITNSLKSAQTQAQQTASAVKQVGTSLLSLKAEKLRNLTFDIGSDKNGDFSFQKTLDNAREAINQIGKFKSVKFNWNLDKDTGEIKSLTATIQDSQGVIQNYIYSLKELGYAFSYVSGSGTDKSMEKMLISIQKAQDKIKALRTDLASTLKSVGNGYSDPNAVKPIVDDTHLKNLNTQYVHALRSIADLKNADDTTMASMKANAESEIEKLKQMVKQYQNAEYAATSLRTKDIGTIKTNQTNELNEFIAQVNRSKVPIDTMTKDIEELKTALNGIGDKDSLTKFLNQFDNAKSKFESVKATYQSIADKIKELQRIQSSGTFNKNSSNSTVINLKQQITTLLADYEKLKTQLNSNVTPQGLTDIGNKLTQLNTQFNDATTTAKRFETELRNDNGAEQLSQKVALLTQRIKAYRQANSKSEKMFGSQYDSMLSQLANPNIDLNTYNALNKQFQIMRQEINAANVAGKNLWQTLKEKVAKFTGWMSMTYAISLVTRTIRSMVTDVVELDTALIDLKKTFKGTNADLKEFYYEANNVAKQLGVTTQEVINTASSWSRLGYNTKEAAIEMSKYASMFKMISPNMSIEDSTDGLLSVMKAFDIEVNDVLDGVMSKINKVGNEFGTSNNEIVQMLMRSSSAMKEGNNTLAETIALETSAVEITRDYASVGTAYKTLAMRLRGYDEELETYSNDVQVLSGEIADLTKTAKNPSGVSLFKDEAKTEYKSTLEILRDIREVYDDLDDKTQAQLLEKIAGKRQGQIVAATLSNWDTVEKALVAMENADGSALNEMNTVMESISYRANIFRETLVGIAQGSFSQTFLTSMVDSGTRILNVFDDLSPSISFILEQFATLLEFVTKLADTIGGIPLLIAGIGLKNVGSPKMFGLVLICQQ